MTRMTRAEGKARTRTQLLRTARELFLRDGYLATSLDKVADTAGFSKGAVYSNFRNKDELCLAVLDELRAERVAEITGLLAAPTTEERLRRFEEWAQRVIGDPQWTSLEFEFAVQARRDPGLRQEMSDRLTAVTRIVEYAVAGLTAGHAIENERRHDAAESSHRPVAGESGPGEPDASGESNAGSDVGVSDAGRSGASASGTGASGTGQSSAGESGPGSVVGGSEQGGHGERVSAPMAGDEAAIALLCLGVGLGLFRSIDPSIPVGALVNTVRVLTGLPAAR